MSVFIRRLAFLCALLLGLVLISVLHLNSPNKLTLVNLDSNHDDSMIADKEKSDFKIRRIVTKAKIQNDEVRHNARQHDKFRQYHDDAPLPRNSKASQLYAQSIKHHKSSQPAPELKPQLIRNTKDSIGDKSHKFDVVHGTSALSLHPDFHPVGSTSVLAYSAHYDHMIGTLKVIGLGPMSDNSSFLEGLKCMVLDRSGKNETVPLETYYHLTTFSPWPGQILDSFIYQCESRFPTPALVLLSSSGDNSNIVQLPVELRVIPTGNSFQFQFAVCVEPIVKSFNDTNAIKHYVAANSMYGAEHFYFYVTDASKEVEDLLNRLPMVTVYHWRLGDLLKQTHAFAQKAAYAHCLHNHRHRAHYLAFIDIDEVLVPRMYTSWGGMVEFLTEDGSSNIGAMVFQSKLFSKDATQDLLTSAKTQDFIRKNGVVSLSALKTVGLFPLYQWSKVLVDTTRTEIMDIHKVRQMYSGYEVLNVKPDFGVVHHYRHYEETHAQLSIDNHMSKVMGKLLNTYQHLFAGIGL